MSILRIFGLIIGAVGLLLTFRIYRGPKWKRINFLFFGAFSLFLIIFSIFPDLLNYISGVFSLRLEERGRIIFLLISSNITLWFFAWYFSTKINKQNYQLDLLIRSLGREQLIDNLRKRINQKEIIIVIPAFNEAENLKELLKKIPNKIKRKKLGVLVIDDGSTDDTAKIVKKAGYLVVKNKINRGGGAALRLGYDILENTNCSVCVTMDADGQHNPKEIETLVKPILENKYDFVIGSRVLGNWEKDSIFRIFGFYISNLLLSFLLGKRITDCASGFRAFKISLLKSITLREDQYHTSELLIDAVKKGLRMGEVPISILKRRYGRSKKGENWKYAFNFAKTIIKTWWR